MRVVGILESFGLAEAVGKMVLSDEEIAFMAAAKKRRGCNCVTSQSVTREDRRRIMEIGQKCLKWRSENQ